MAVENKFKADSTSRAKKDSIDRTKDTVLLKDTLLKNKLTDSIARKNDTLTKKQAEEKETWEGKVKGLKFFQILELLNLKKRATILLFIVTVLMVLQHKLLKKDILLLLQEPRQTRLN